MFGFDVILSYLRKQIGLRTDPANAGGSVHGKIAELRAHINTDLAKVQKPRGVANVAGSFFTDQTTYQTALNISGRGRLLTLGLYRTAPAGQAVRVTIDGKVVGLGDGVISTLPSNPWGWIFPSPHFVLQPVEDAVPTNYMRLSPMIIADGSGGFLPWIGSPRLDLSFKSSLKIESRFTNWGAYSNAAYLCWQYEIEE